MGSRPDRRIRFAFFFNPNGFGAFNVERDTGDSGTRFGVVGVGPAALMFVFFL